MLGKVRQDLGLKSEDAAMPKYRGSQRCQYIPCIGSQKQSSAGIDQKSLDAGSACWHIDSSSKLRDQALHSL